MSSGKSSRFSVFGFGGPKGQSSRENGSTSLAPPPPPKEYGFQNRSVTNLSSQAGSDHSLSVPSTPVYGRGDSNNSSVSLASTTAPSVSGKKSGFFSFVKRSPRAPSVKAPSIHSTPTTPDDDGISMPWNFQHNVHVDEGFAGLPPSWTSSLADAGFTPDEIQAIHAKRNAARTPGGQYMFTDRPNSPASVLANPTPRTTSLPRQYSPVTVPPSSYAPSSSSYAPSSHTPSLHSRRTHSDASSRHPEQAESPSSQFVNVDGSRELPPPALELNGGPRPTTPPRRLLRVANGTPLPSPGAGSPPPAYSGGASGFPQEKRPSGDSSARRELNGQRPRGDSNAQRPRVDSNARSHRSRAGSNASRASSRTGSDEDDEYDRRATVTQFPKPGTSVRHSPLYGLEGQSSSGSSSSQAYLADSSSSPDESSTYPDESSVSYYNDEPTYDDAYEDKRATVLASAAIILDDDKRATILADNKRSTILAGKRLTALPPRLSLHEASSSDLSDWSEALLSAIPSELTPDPTSTSFVSTPASPPPPPPPTKDRIPIPVAMQQTRSVSNPTPPSEPKPAMIPRPSTPPAPAPPAPAPRVTLPDANTYKSTFAAAQSKYQVPTTKPWVVASSFGPIPQASVAKAPVAATPAAVIPRATVSRSSSTLYTNGPSPFANASASSSSGSLVEAPPRVGTASPSRLPVPPQKPVPATRVSEWNDEDESDEDEESAMGVRRLSPREEPLTPALSDSQSPVYPEEQHNKNDDLDMLLSANDRDRDSNRDSGMSNISNATVTSATIIVSGVTLATRARANVVPGTGLSVQTTKPPGSPQSEVFSSESGHSSGSGSGGSSEQEQQTPVSEVDLEVPQKSHMTLPYLQPSPMPSPLATSFSPGASRMVSLTDTFGGLEDDDEGEEYTPPPHRPSIVTHTDQLEPPSASSTQVPSPMTPRYRGWVQQVVAPLESFIDHRIDPRDHYVDMQEIAEGESGSVFAARVVVLGSKLPRSDEGLMVAIKQVEIVPSGSPKLTEIQRELKLMKQLRAHENVLSMDALYVDLNEDSLWIRMELQERSLADVVALVEDGLVLPERMMARFASDTLLALEFLQEHRIAHRDVRSDNMLINSDGLLKIADFSNAVEVTPQNPLCMSPAGVLYWQAPEMRTGPYNALKVDVWSLGATVWEMAQAEPPFSDIEDPRDIGSEWPPLDRPEVYSRAFHDFLKLCGTPCASRTGPKELIETPFIRNACGRPVIIQLLAQCRAIEGRGQDADSP